MSVGQMAGMGMQVCWLVKTAEVSRYVGLSISRGRYANMLVGQMARVGLGGMLVSQMAVVGSVVHWLVKTVGYVCRYVGWSKQLG